MPNRYVCDVLKELRKSLDVYYRLVKPLINNAKENEYLISSRHNHLLSLVEEAQTYVNRMEATLGDRWDMHHEQERRTKLKEERRELEKQLKELKKIKGKLKEGEDEQE